MSPAALRAIRTSQQYPLLLTTRMRAVVHLCPRSPWRAPPPATGSALLSNSGPASHPQHRRLSPGFLLSLKPEVPAIRLCRWVLCAPSNAMLDDILQGELDNAKGHQKHEAVGAFQKIPMVMPATDILMSAQRKSRNVPPTKGIANVAKRERNKGAKQLDALMKELSVPLRTYTENFPKRKHLHPYERSLIELTFGEGNYEQVIGRVDALRKRITSVGKQHASVCAKSTTKREAEDRLAEGRKKLEEAFQEGKHTIDDLVNVAKALRSMPVVDLHIPTLCLVGSPNVGKSSLVRILSSGKPEVCSYPFTTRGVLMGHIVSNHKRFQVTDTPGLLTRHDDDRNNIERLTLAVISYLPIAVLYVHDLSEDCGTSVADQYTTYKHIKERFGDRLWLDVISKCDLLGKTAANNFYCDDNDEELWHISRWDIQVALRCGCPSTDRKVVNSGKRLRAYVGLDEGEVCSQCSLRGNCERAYVKARKEEIGRTVDVMRILLTYGLDVSTGNVENRACLGKTVKESVKYLLNEVVEVDSSGSGSSIAKVAQHKGQSAVPMKQGDWNCPKCNFLNFAKNIKCLHCNGEFQERYQLLHEDQEHLPLKKGDWICKKCNFLNFAKNTRCLQCHEKPTNRFLNPGEWECVSCNYLNFKRNGFCLKCGWKRPKSLNIKDSIESQHDLGHNNNPAISFVQDGVQLRKWQTPHKNAPITDDDSDFWSSEEEHDDYGTKRTLQMQDYKFLESFPIVGSKTATSQDPVAREKWKEDMSRRPRGFPKESHGSNQDLSPVRLPRSMDLVESDDDEISEWFSSGNSSRNSEKA